MVLKKQEKRHNSQKDKIYKFPHGFHAVFYINKMFEHCIFLVMLEKKAKIKQIN